MSKILYNIYPDKKYGLNKYIEYCNTIINNQKKLQQSDIPVIYDSWCMNTFNKKISEINNKKRLLIVGKNPSIEEYVIDYFPLTQFDIICRIEEDKPTTNQTGTNISQIIDDTDFVLMLSENQETSKNIPFEKQIKLWIEEDSFLGTHLVASFGICDDPKIISLIPNRKMGLLWHLEALTGIMQKIETKSIIVDMKNYPNDCVDPDYLGIFNAWDCFFKQPTSIPLEEAYSSREVHFVKMFRYQNNSDWSLISNNILNLADSIETRFNNKKTMGVLLRGTDYNYTPWHPHPYDPYEAAYIVKSYMNNFDIDQIFLSTEDQNNYDVFKKIFKESIYTICRERINEAKNSIGPSGNPYRLMLISECYLVETILLTKMYGILATPCGSTRVLKSIGVKWEFFDTCLSKYLNGTKGLAPLKVSFSGKNLIDPKTISFSRCEKYTLRTDGSFHTSCANYCILHIPVYLKSNCPYVMSIYTSGNIIESTYSCECGKKNSFSNNITFIPDDTVKSIDISIEGEECDTKLQLEQNFVRTKYEPFYQSSSEIAFRSTSGLYYRSDCIEEIDVENETFTINGEKHTFHNSEKKVLIPWIKYPGGQITYCLNNTQYYKFHFWCKSHEMIKDPLDYEYIISLYYDPRSLHILEECIYSLLCESVKGINNTLSGLCNVDKSNPINSYYIGLLSRLNCYEEECVIITPRQIPTKNAQYTPQTTFIDLLLNESDTTNIDCYLILSNLNTYTNKSVVEYLAKCTQDKKSPHYSLIESKKWWELGVELNVRNAAYGLFDVLWNIGTEESYLKMIKLIAPLANKGEGHALGRLGRAYRDGKGVPQDYNKAMELMQKAADLGIRYSVRELDELKNKLNI